MIRVEGLTKAYGPRVAVSDITFHAEKGEILGFLGPNGAGKTTTMRILSGYMPPTAGKAEVAGYDVVSDSLEVRKRVGYVPETVPLYNDMTISEYLKYMADLRKMKDADARVNEVIEQVGMLERADSYIGNLSKGMRQRVGLAQALIHRPEVLILDEPTIGLDPAQIIEVRNLIRDLGQDRTVLLSTHILSEAQQVCNRVLIINNGKIVAEDTPEHLQARVTGAQRYSLKVGGDEDGLSALVNNVAGVRRVINAGAGAIEFETYPEKDVRPDVARAVVNAGFDLLELHPIGYSLEDIFLKLTRDEPTAPEMIDRENEPLASERLEE
jgi:ABC-2 type transport system ATP-binding protein